MAQYIKLRLTAAKVGVSMALVGLIAGLAERARSAPPVVNATQAAASSGAPTSLLKLDKSFIKLDSALAKIEHKLAKTYFTSQKIDSTFLKIKSANTSFLKIKSANASFLKIDDANTQFLKIDDAGTEFLKIDGVAANSSELGGAQADAYVNNAVGSASVPTSGGTAALVHTPDGKLSISVGYGVVTVGAGPVPIVTITNSTSGALPAVQDVGGTDKPVSLAPGSGNQIDLPSIATTGATMLHLQLFPVQGLFGSATAEAVTLVLSADLNGPAGTVAFVGQLIAGTL